MNLRDNDNLYSDKSLKICDFGFARVLAPKNDNLTDYVATRW